MKKMEIGKLLLRVNKAICNRLKQAAQEQEPCEDAISRQAVLDYIWNDLGLGDEENGKDVERQMELDSSYRYIKSLSPVNPQPKTGHWIRKTNDYGASSYMCSECGRWHPTHNHSLGFDYCNGCGARMVESQESEDKE